MWFVGCCKTIAICHACSCIPVYISSINLLGVKVTWEKAMLAGVCSSSLGT